MHRSAGDDVALTHGLAQLFQEFRHTTVHPHLGSIGRTDLTGPYRSASAPSASRRRSSATWAETSCAAVGAASLSSTAIAR